MALDQCSKERGDVRRHAHAHAHAHAHTHAHARAHGHRILFSHNPCLPTTQGCG
jgi:hypothetical protein